MIFSCLVYMLRALPFLGSTPVSIVVLGRLRESVHVVVHHHCWPLAVELHDGDAPGARPSDAAAILGGLVHRGQIKGTISIRFSTWVLGTTSMCPWVTG